MLGCVLLAWEDAASMGERFERVRDLLGHALPRTRRLGWTYQGLAKAMLRHGVELVDQVRTHLRRESLRRCGSLRGVRDRCGFQALAVDGSRFDAPRTISNEEALGLGGKAGTHPQMMVTSVWHMGTGLPWDWRIGRADAAERTQLRDMIDALPERCLLVVDAGFTGYELLKRIIDSARHVLVRVGSHVTLLAHDRLDQVRRQGGRVWLRRERQPALPLRLIVVGRGAKAVYLVTNVLDEQRLSDAQAARLYAMRWGIEVFHRQAKQTLERRKLRSANAQRAVLEMHWTLIGLWLLLLMTASEQVAAGRDPLAVSVAAAARVTRRWIARMESRGLAQRVLRQLRCCVKDDAPRRAGKTSHNWPHKKKDPRPKPPKLRRVRLSQLQIHQPLPTRLNAA